ncbi:MAG TPA: hypothetical protein VMS64_26370 [Candidatus Methylomirabilis sp.]|nr:hypothetical protein [Candidatus Methylomirabilis sp.]
MASGETLPAAPQAFYGAEKLFATLSAAGDAYQIMFQRRAREAYRRFKENLQARPRDAADLRRAV